MNILTELAFVESKSLRDRQLSTVSHDRASEILSLVKAVYFALWQGTGTATTGQIAEFYEVSLDVVQKALQRHRDEFINDGLKTLRGKQLKDAADTLSIPSKTSQFTIWTPRAALRLGMLLRDSLVAKAVRTSLLDLVEKVVPAQASELERLKLELELAKTQERLLTTTSAIATMHGSGMVALILGKPEAVITLTERVETVVTVDKKGKAIANYDGVGISYLARRYNFKTTSSCRCWLESIGVSDAQWLCEPSLVISRKLPRSFLPWLDAQYAARTGVRQKLIGE
ncbi:MAG: DNA-binding protein [Hydrococcus sp. CRU_1_1]|nr:DNA-binding protein [Hydrococcus sp. CRU_1_1]